jgi:hypothetical protein
MIVNKEGCTEMHFSPEKNDEKEVGPKMGFARMRDHSLKVTKRLTKVPPTTTSQITR